MITVHWRPRGGAIRTLQVRLPPAAEPVDPGENDVVEPPPGPTYLLDYEDATFTRSSEAAAVDPRDGWTWYDLTAPWPGVNVPRIMADGAILIEGPRTNAVFDSANLNAASWTREATINGGADAAPDGAANAYRLDNDGAAPDRLYDVVPGGGYAVSAYIKAAGGTTIGFRKGATGVFDASPAPAEWGRVSFTDPSQAYVLAFAHVAPEAGAGAPGADVGLWGAQAEPGTFATSPIRTAGAAGARAADVCEFPLATAYPAALLSGAWTIKVWPAFASDNLQNPSAGLLSFALGTGIDLDFELRAGLVRVVQPGVGLRVSRACTWSAHQELTLTFDGSAGSLTIAGATTGDGTTTEAGWTLDDGKRLRVGTGNFAVIGRPVAA